MADVFDTFGDEIQYEFINTMVAYLASECGKDDNFVLTKFRKVMVTMFDENEDMSNLTAFANLSAERRKEAVDKCVTDIIVTLRLPQEPHHRKIMQIYSNWKKKHDK